MATRQSSRMKVSAGAIGTIAPAESVVWLDLMAYREVTAAVQYCGNTELRVRVMVGRGTDDQLHVEVGYDGGTGVWDGNSGRRAEGGMFVIAAEDWTGLVALHGALGAVLAKAREIGWCDAHARFHGSDAPFMGESTEADDAP